MGVRWDIDRELGIPQTSDYMDDYIAQANRLENTFGPTVETLQWYWKTHKKPE